jgi:hypothetical protein
VALTALGLGSVSHDLRRAEVAEWLAAAPPPPQRYPDVTAAVTEWLDAGAGEPLADLSHRLWRATTAPAAGGVRGPG